MSDIWSVGDSDGSVGKGPASDEWDCDSESSEEEQPARKRAKRGASNRQRPQVGNNAVARCKQSCHPCQFAAASLSLLSDVIRSRFDPGLLAGGHRTKCGLSPALQPTQALRE